MQYLWLTGLFFSALACKTEKMKVCKTFRDYYIDPDTNGNCYFNPDVYLDEPNVIRRHGYPLEIYKVATRDGFILTLFRIPCGRAMTCLTCPPVFIQHGVCTSSAYFYSRGNTSLAFILADRGHDVWMGNFRAVRYSDQHKFFNKKQWEYWNFSFHELGIYDLPAQLDFVRKLTGQKVIYIGYSMGSTAFYVYGSEFPDDAFANVRLAIGFAPISFLRYVETPMRYMTPLWPVLEGLFYRFTNGSITERSSLLSKLITKLCLPYPFQMKLCNMLYGFTGGLDLQQMDPELQPLIFLKYPDAFSVKIISHYIQLIHSGSFSYFDYGKKNKEFYGTSIPPLYKLYKMKVPNYFIRAKNDRLATEKNVDMLHMSLPEAATPFPIYVIEYEKFQHLDYVYAKDVKTLLYDHVVEFIENICTP